jgi:hypothetical protein
MQNKKENKKHNNITHMGAVMGEKGGGGGGSSIQDRAVGQGRILFTGSPAIMTATPHAYADARDHAHHGL